MNFPADTPSLGFRKLRHRRAVPRVQVVTWVDAKPLSCPLLPCPLLPRQPSTAGPVGMASLVTGPRGLVSTVYLALATPYHFPEPNITSEGPKRREAPWRCPGAGGERARGRGFSGRLSVYVCVGEGWDPGALKGRRVRHTFPWPLASM